MNYSINSSEIQDFYSKEYLEIDTPIPFSIKADEIDMGPLKMSIKEWRTPKLWAHLVHSKADRNMQFTGKILPDVAILHFVCKGKTHINNKPFYSSQMNTNTNNFFCAMGDEITHQLIQNQQDEYFKIFLPYSYIHSITTQYPDIFGALSQLIEHQCPILRDGNLTTTMEMNHVIEQIKNCQDMGSLASFYFETKVHELLILQIHQISKQECSNCSCHIHYRKQINEARNIIENQYQNPPSISELALTAGMSETVLKTSFKLFFETTIYGYLFNFRMNIAHKLLLDTTLTIAEIAMKSGYEYPSHFATAFKRRYGVAPNAFRKNSVYLVGKTFPKIG